MLRDNRNYSSLLFVHDADSFFNDRKIPGLFHFCLFLTFHMLTFYLTRKDLLDRRLSRISVWFDRQFQMRFEIVSERRQSGHSSIFNVTQSLKLTFNYSLTSNFDYTRNMKICEQQGTKRYEKKSQRLDR